MHFNKLLSRKTITHTLENLKNRNIIGYYAENKLEALEKLKSLIPVKASVMTGSSVTLDQIGFIDFLKDSRLPWVNLKNKVLNEKDPAKQAQLRKTSTMADCYIGSVHALTVDGESVIASASGSQIPAYAFNSDNVIWVVGAQKIVPDLKSALKRVREYVFPLEDKRMKEMGFKGSHISMMLIFEKVAFPGRKVHLILVNEKLGF